MAESLPQGAVGVWPTMPGFKVYEYAPLPPERAWKTGTDSYGRPYRYKLTSREQDVAITYQPQLPKADTYVIEVFVPAENAQARNAGYHVVYYEGTVRRERVMKVDQAANAGQWVSLGTYTLDPRFRDAGRINVTDFSPEDNVPIAFGGIRWVPASVRAVVEQKPPVTVVTQGQPTLTNQDAINAFIVAAAAFNEKFTDWVTAARLDSIYQNRKAAFTTDVRTLPALGEQRIAALAQALQMPPKQLAEAAVKASRPTPVSTVGASGGQRASGRVDGRTWGIHGSAGFGVPPRHLWDFWIGELKAMGIKWYKQCDNGGDDTGPNSCFAWVLALRDAGITPVIRYQQGEQFPGRLADNYFNKMAQYAKNGVVYAEIGNEPNLPWEWSGEWRNRLAFHNPDVVRIINENWLNDAERAIRVGARPAYYAFAPTDWRGGYHPNLSSVAFYDYGFRFLGAQHRQRTLNVFRNGGWLAVHVSTYEQPPDFDPFAHNPVWDMCLRGYEVPLKYLRQHLGLDTSKLDIMSTEGGVFTPESTSMNNRPRLSGDGEHARKTLEMFDYIETSTPLMAMMPWCIAVDSRIGHRPEEYVHDGWYVERGGQLVAREVVRALKQTYSARKGGR